MVSPGRRTSRLDSSQPQARFELSRFRPNVVIELASGAEGSVENAWVGHTLPLGETVSLRITRRCPRCVMTTPAHVDLRIPRIASQHNQVSVGIYASLARGGPLHRGDAIRLGED
jgi:uncharacterized protein YcbX